ncbi:MAG: ABC transporter ATP-binding protein/permease [Xanthobacteraceae bacterium]|nr:ABC transporter ATP-binding protein/permease [Xanthobacteraceae bacterium]
MKNIGPTLAVIWRLAIPYFRSEDKWAGRLLLCAIVLIELGTVVIDVLLNQWRNRFYNALQEYNWGAFVHEIIYFSVVAAIFITIAVYQLYLNQWLQIRWRKWMTEHYLARWLDSGAHYGMQLAGDPADNPDQRIAEDIRQFIDDGSGSGLLPIGLGLLNSVVTLISFVVILWGLSESAPLHVFGLSFDLPGYLVWAALAYSIVGTWLTHLVGRPLVGLDYQQQRYEADFRFNLVRTRENAEQIALLRGEKAEHLRLSQRIDNIVRNWLNIMTRTKKITALTSSYSQAVQVFPYVLVAPAYFAKRTELGGLIQAASAFLSVQGALSFFVSSYRSIAGWQAVITRLDGFDKSIAAASELGSQQGAITRRSGNDPQIELADLEINLPDGVPLVTADRLVLREGEHTLLQGPSGIGKSTLFRVISGIWPFGKGTVSIPAGTKLMTLPQRPYLPIGPLADAVAYPALPGTFDNAQIGSILRDVGLASLADRLDEPEHWSRLLSLGEQQRLGIARALLHAPQFLLLDEAMPSSWFHRYPDRRSRTPGAGALRDLRPRGFGTACHPIKQFDGVNHGDRRSVVISD